MLAGQRATPAAERKASAHLEGITRGINPGDPVLFEQTGPTRRSEEAPRSPRCSTRSRTDIGDR